MPFGMVQLSPDTRTDNWDGSSGYHYSDDIIYGFSHTHLSGTGIPDYCDILFMPTLVPAAFLQESWRMGRQTGMLRNSRTQNEKAEPGYYSVRLDDGDSCRDDGNDASRITSIHISARQTARGSSWISDWSGQDC